jgi:hypothetical protein
LQAIVWCFGKRRSLVTTQTPLAIIGKSNALF